MDQSLFCAARYSCFTSLLLLKKKLQADKPDSVPLSGDYHLSVLNITVGINLPTRYRVRQDLSEQLSNDTLCGISACKVYPRVMLPLQAVGSYPTFSPLLLAE